MAPALSLSGFLNPFRLTARSRVRRARPEEMSSRDDDAEAARERREFILEMMDAHPGAFSSGDSFGAAMSYFSRRL